MERGAEQSGEGELSKKRRPNNNPANINLKVVIIYWLVWRMHKGGEYCTFLASKLEQTDANLLHCRTQGPACCKFVNRECDCYIM